jgi:2-polyprenyl-6-methoxyphenol hydroxylase-like FAD-dependent oxidoreductase
MAGLRVLISGAGIAGPALAYWLGGRDFEVTVVERALTLREGGQAVDFRGPVHREVLERMRLWGPILERQTPGCDLVLLDSRGRPAVTLPSLMMSGDVEILRGDLSRLLYEHSAISACYRFGEQITDISQSGTGVAVRFSHGAPEQYDLVVGADGLHSGVRALVFGAESRYLVHHGYRLATFSLPDVLDLRGRAYTYTVPGRSVTVRSEGHGRARASFIFAGAPLGEERGNAVRTGQLLREAYRDVQWEVPRLLAHVDAADDLYIDQIGSIVIERYGKGRVVLLGDAAYGGTLGGQGTPLAIVGAYVLAEELVAAHGDVRAAVARYEALMRPYAIEGQKGAKNVGRFFAPKTALGLALRDLFYRAMTSRPLMRQFEKLVKASASKCELPRYGHLRSSEMRPTAPRADHAT